jgi:hypothetical protein
MTTSYDFAPGAPRYDIHPKDLLRKVLGALNVLRWRVFDIECTASAKLHIGPSAITAILSEGPSVSSLRVQRYEEEGNYRIALHPCRLPLDPFGMPPISVEQIEGGMLRSSERGAALQRAILATMETTDPKGEHP